MREGIPLDALNWFGRGYELNTPKSVGLEGSKAWALSVVPHFSLSPPRLAFLAWVDFHARSRFARSTIPEKKWGLLIVYQFPGSAVFVLKAASNVSICIKHVSPRSPKIVSPTFRLSRPHLSNPERQFSNNDVACSFTSHKNKSVKVLWDGTYGFSS